MTVRGSPRVGVVKILHLFREEEVNVLFYSHERVIVDARALFR